MESVRGEMTMEGSGVWTGMEIVVIEDAVFVVALILIQPFEWVPLQKLQLVKKILLFEHLQVRVSQYLPSEQWFLQAGCYGSVASGLEKPLLAGYATFCFRLYFRQ